jgi:hypothetical protein
LKVHTNVRKFKLWKLIQFNHWKNDKDYCASRATFGRPNSGIAASPNQRIGKGYSHGTGQLWWGSNPVAGGVGWWGSRPRGKPVR